MSYIEAGWPASNPKDLELFKEVKKLSLANSEVVAFGSTHRKGIRPKEDSVFNTLLSVDVATVVIFGKAWTLHVREVLKASYEENLRMVKDSIEYLKDHGLKVIFDAEHYFDGFKEDPSYALKVVEAAEEGGADVIVLCDTNGGSLPSEVQQVIRNTKRRLKVSLGIHCHNDLGLAVANTLTAVQEGVRHIHGTVNGLGERCGNTDLCQLLPTLHFKLGLKALNSSKPFKEQLKGLTDLSQYVYQLTNLPPQTNQPYVGSCAFIHKGGVHVDATLKELKAYEHIDPSLVGNKRELSISELSGKAAVIKEAMKLGIKLEKKSGLVGKVLGKIKQLESEGYHFENAKASVHLLILKELGYVTRPFEIKYWKTTSSNDEVTKATAEVIVQVDGEVYQETSKGDGPVHALDLALRKALLRRLPQLKNVKLINYKVTVIDSISGTASKVRVFIEFEDDGLRWATTSVSTNIIEASASALTDGYVYRLLLDKLRKI